MRQLEAKLSERTPLGRATATIWGDAPEKKGQAEGREASIC